MEDNESLMEQAVDIMAEEYRNDKELTALTQLDWEDFYEPSGTVAG
jgi:hypothetical protein